jgi:hypothetical protein
MPLKAPRLIVTLLSCGAAIALFVVLSHSAALRKSATLDEPLHVASAFAATHLHDYRLDAENPPLWKYWSMLAVGGDAIRVDPSDPVWQRATHGGEGQVFATRALYQTPGIDGRAIVDAARGAMVLLGVLVLIAAAAWTYKLAGAAAAVCACVLLAFDPTLLAHAPIVKNDVAMTLLMLLLVFALTSAVAAVKPWNLALVAAACGGAMSVKFSGLLWPVITATVLIGRAMLPRPWTFMGRALSSRLKRIAAVAAMGVAIALISYVTIWASYGFRYSVAPDPAVSMDVEQRANDVARQELAARIGRPPTPDEIATQPLPLAARIVLAINRHRLMPQAWSAGFLGVRGAMARHQNYLFGQVKWGGWWYYFPVAFVVKTPLATLAAVALAMALALRLRRRLDISDPARRALAVIGVAAAIYLASAMTQDINHGVRHLLPIIVLLFIATAIVLAGAARLRPRASRIAAAVLGVALAAESLAAFPNYIPFFNLAAGGTHGGLKILGDSNLDWGQDLPELAAWRRANPHVRLYLCYYGAADPAAHGIADYVNLPGGFFLGPPSEHVTTPGVVAMSATRLQGLYMSEELRASYTRLQKWPVREVLPGGTIYLFDHPPADQPMTTLTAPPAPPAPP